MAHHQCKFLYNDVQKDSTITNKDIYWKDVPKEIRNRHYKILEQSTERINIRISECVGHWVAEALFRRQYEHHFNPKKERTATAIEENSNNDSSSPSSREQLEEDGHPHKRICQ